MVLGVGAGVVAELVGMEAAVLEAVGIEGAGEGAGMLLSAGRSVASPGCYSLRIFILFGGMVSN